MCINNIEFSAGKEQHPKEVYLAALYNEEEYKCLWSELKDLKHFL